MGGLKEGKERETLHVVSKDSYRTCYNISQILWQYLSFSENLQLLSNNSFSLSILSMTVLFNMEVETGNLLHLNKCVSIYAI